MDMNTVHNTPGLTRRMRQMLLPLSLAAICPVALAQSAQAPQCPFTAEDLSSKLGRPFKPGVPEQGIVGKACAYAADGVKLWIDAGPNPAPSAEMFRKMSNPPGTSWRAVPNDPDKAVHTIPKADISAFSSLSYERKGWLVNITLTGVTSKADADVWNAKLVQLKRVP